MFAASLSTAVVLVVVVSTPAQPPEWEWLVDDRTSLAEFVRHPVKPFSNPPLTTRFALEAEAPGRVATATAVTPATPAVAAATRARSDCLGRRVPACREGRKGMHILPMVKIARPNGVPSATAFANDVGRIGGRL